MKVVKAERENLKNEKKIELFTKKTLIIITM
jgi:hypothetical protein